MADINNRHVGRHCRSTFLLLRADIDGRQSCGLQHLNNYSVLPAGSDVILDFALMVL